VACSLTWHQVAQIPVFYYIVGLMANIRKDEQAHSNFPGYFKKLQGKTALITGGATRIGRALALSLAEVGINVVVHYRQSVEPAQEVARLVAQRGPKAWLLQGDFCQTEQIASLFTAALQMAGTIDFLINSASIFPKQTLFEAQVEDYLTNIRINALAPFLLSRAFYEQNRPGQIINFLDTRILDYDKLHVPYHVSKRLLYTFTRMASLEFAPRVQVNAIAPGVILPPPEQADGEAYLAKLVSSNPLQRIGTVEELALTVLFLLASDFITGQVIYVDGGRHLKSHTYGA
jgi:NAD(P)-dependent dehydrogenase (short-subunit alcohol dehydrogenase family)